MVSRRWIVAVLFGLGFAIGLRPIAGMDFHWHLAMGRAWLDGVLPAAEDPFTHLPTLRHPEMGGRYGQMLLAWVHGLGGLRGVQILIAAVSGGIWVQGYRLGRRWTRGSEPALLVAAFAAAAATLRLRGRPDIFTVLLGLTMLETLARRPGWRRDALVLGVAALWANLHAGAIIAPALALAAAIGPDWRIGLRTVAAAILGISLTPQGPFDLIELARATQDTSHLVPEWQPLWRLSLLTVRTEIALGLAVALASLWALPRWRSAPIAHGCLAVLGLGVMAYGGIRLLFFGVAPLAWALGCRREWLSVGRRGGAVLGLAALVVIAGPLWQRIEVARATRAAGLGVWAPMHEPNYPTKARNFLSENKLIGNMMHPVRWGGYLLEGLAPPYRTAHDGRITIFGRHVAEGLQAFETPIGRPHLIARFDLEILVLERGWLPPAERADPARPDDDARRWLLVHSDGVAEVFIDRFGPNWARNRDVLARLTRGR